MKLILAALFTFISLSSHAYMNLLTTGELVPTNHIQAMGYLENVFDTYSGLNVNARGSYGISDELQADVELGAGKFNFMTGAFVKWVPIPDINKQPAIGVRAGIGYINADNTSETSISATPFISKGFMTDQGRFTPYGGVQLATNSNKYDTYFSSRLIIGTEWKSPLEEYKDLRVLAEFGFELSKSFNSLSAGAAYTF